MKKFLHISQKVMFVIVGILMVILGVYNLMIPFVNNALIFICSIFIISGLWSVFVGFNLKK